MCFTHFCEHTGNRIVPYPIIDCNTYGIAGYIPVFSCENRQQVQEYFRGMGIHLFLCYLLHAGDMHQENIVASVMPVLVDAETIPGIQRRGRGKNAEDQVNDRLGWNVLHTGILPFPVWRDNRKGTIISALHMANEVYSPMKLPVVKNEKTSNQNSAYETHRHLIERFGLDDMNEMREYQKHFSLTTEQEHSRNIVGREIVNTILADTMLPQDRYSMGLMTGLSGIGVCLGTMLGEDNKISHYMTE